MLLYRALATAAELYPGRDTFEFDQAHDQESTYQSSRFFDLYITMLDE